MNNAKDQTSNHRPSRSEIYMATAELFAKRSTCLRKDVGAVLVRDSHILGTGYNGAPRSQPECYSDGCFMVDNHCVRTVHAEVNAILAAAHNGVSTYGSTLYTTVRPCFRCQNFLINAGVKLVWYLEEYNDGINQKVPDVIQIHRWNHARTQ